MRFCPFCSAENSDDSATCASCSRRLPPLPPRRAGTRTGAPPTGILLPVRPPSAAQPPTQGARSAPQGPRPMTPVAPVPLSPRKPGSTQPPPIPGAALAPAAAPIPGAAPVVPAATTADVDATVVTPKTPSVAELDGAAAQLRNALSPSPAAERREATPADDQIIGDRRGLNPKPPTAPPPIASPPLARSKTPSMGWDLPPDRAKSPTAPPPAPPAVVSPDRAKSSTAPPPAPPAVASPDRPKPPSNPPPLPELPKTPSPAPRPAPASVMQSDPALSSIPQPSAVAASDTEPSPAPHMGMSRAATPTPLEPPPTRIHRPDALVDRPFTPPKVLAVPEVPEPGLFHAARYAYQFAIARWQRRGAIKQLGTEIKQDTEALDQVLGALGRAARGARVEGRVFSAENSAITAAEERAAQLQRESGEVESRKGEESSRFVDIERERNDKLAEAERTVESAQQESQHLEAQRRSLRDKRKELERRQKAYLKNADDQDKQAGTAPLGDQRQEFRRAAEGHRKEAAALEPDKQDIDRRISALERPISDAIARLDTAKAELDAAKRSLSDAREGHTHRLAELDAEQKRKTREVNLAEAEILRRLVTLGTLLNLNRIEDPRFAELYQRIDRLRGAITARTTEIEKLAAEREAYDRGTLVRGVATIGGATVALIALIVILRAVL